MSLFLSMKNGGLLPKQRQCTLSAYHLILLISKHYGYRVNASIIKWIIQHGAEVGDNQ